MNKVKKIRIRMYRHGLGDCFLLTIYYGKASKYNILIDCGVILGTAEPDKKMQAVAENIAAETENNIDCVVITHEHWDHLSGFKQAREVFDNINFKEVWMAWTEDPENTLANELRGIRENRKKTLAAALEKLKAELDANQFLTPKQKTARGSFLNAIEETTSFSGGLGLAGSSSTLEALNYVKGKAADNLFFCTPGTDPFSITNIDGLRIFVLGPPEDAKLIKKSLSDKEVYQKLFMSEVGNSFLSALSPDASEATQDKYRPFDKYTGIKLEDAVSYAASYYNPANDWRKIDTDWMDYAGQLALALDSDTNNTSLVLAIELTENKKFLLFPGDAQVGNWLSWHNYTWTVKNEKDEEEVLDIQKIFERTVFYKVGHHGSHNATLSEKGLELMKHKELVAMVPVNKEMAKKKRWDMPLPSLYKRLKEKASGRVLIADEDFDATIPKPANVSADAWAKYIKAVSAKDPLFVDYTIVA